LTIVGLGYVGLPLAQEAARSGIRVTGFDVSGRVVGGLMAGRSHVDDLDGRDVMRMLDDGFTATTDPACLAASDAIVICVPTPLSDDGAPDLSAVVGASETIAAHLRPGTIVVLESTTYPGTTDDVVRPVLEAGSGLTAGVDFHLAFSPERIDPGNAVYGIRNTPKVVGGHTEACTDRAVELYERIVDTVVPTVGTREAEMAKLLENTYRHVNIALMNEMSVFCHDLGIDLWAAIEAAKTKPFGFQAFYPGPGVGGHCIPIDPNYLGYAVRSLGYQFRFVELAQEITGRRPSYVGHRAQLALNEAEKPVKGSTVLLLGVTYKANISDDRETPARPVAAKLIELGADVRYYDPHVESFEVDGVAVPAVDDLEIAIVDADLSILITAHDEIVDSPAIDKAERILDTRGVLDGIAVERL
jgi:nucleotide sugar dehydrogenase